MFYILIDFGANISWWQNIKIVWRICEQVINHAGLESGSVVATIPTMWAKPSRNLASARFWVQTALNLVQTYLLDLKWQLYVCIWMYWTSLIIQNKHLPIHVDGIPVISHYIFYLWHYSIKVKLYRTLKHLHHFFPNYLLIWIRCIWQ